MHQLHSSIHLNIQVIWDIIPLNMYFSYRQTDGWSSLKSMSIIFLVTRDNILLISTTTVLAYSIKGYCLNFNESSTDITQISCFVFQLKPLTEDFLILSRECASINVKQRFLSYPISNTWSFRLMPNVLLN